MNAPPNSIAAQAGAAGQAPVAILAFDTSTEYCSVAVLLAPAGADPFAPWQASAVPGEGDPALAMPPAGPCIHVRHELTGAVSSARLLPLIQEVLAEAGIALAQCSAIAFGAGPGSFTGLRTATGVAQGLAFGAGIPVVPVGTLMACAELARAMHPHAACVVSALDARMDEAYWGVFDWQGGVQADAPLGWQCAPAAALDAPERVPVPARPYLLAGNAAAVFGERLTALGQATALAAQALPHASAIARLGWRGWSRGQALDAAQAAPLYIRDKVAQTTAEREHAKTVRDAAAADAREADAVAGLPADRP